MKSSHSNEIMKLNEKIELIGKFLVEIAEYNKKKRTWLNRKLNPIKPEIARLENEICKVFRKVHK